MQIQRLWPSLLSLLIASGTAAVTMDWTFVGDPGNACDPQPDSLAPGGCFGAVEYAYNIGTHEVTNAQYAEFLNAKAASDPLGLYNPRMGDPSRYFEGGITRSGSNGSYRYSTIAGRENMPVNNVSFVQAMRFANWMNNGQGAGGTETGSYTLLGGTPIPSNGETVTRNAIASIVVTSEDEWYKAAYYNASPASYFAYPAGHNQQTTCRYDWHAWAPNSANCSGGMGTLTNAGTYYASPSPYGTFDQGGNVWEWNEALIPPSPWNPPGRGLRGGGFFNGPEYLAASMRSSVPGSWDQNFDCGFRVAMVPEPRASLLQIAGLLSVLGLAGSTRRSS